MSGPPGPCGRNFGLHFLHLPTPPASGLLYIWLAREWWEGRKWDFGCPKSSKVDDECLEAVGCLLFIFGRQPCTASKPSLEARSSSLGLKAKARRFLFIIIYPVFVYKKKNKRKIIMKRRWRRGAWEAGKENGLAPPGAHARVTVGRAYFTGLAPGPGGPTVTPGARSARPCPETRKTNKNIKENQLSFNFPCLLFVFRLFVGQGARRR